MDVAIAAAGAYCSTDSGDDDDYVLKKSISFVNRCIADDRDYDGMISKDAIDRTAFAALDDSCTSVLNQYLSMRSINGSQVFQRFSSKLAGAFDE